MKNPPIIACTLPAIALAALVAGRAAAQQNLTVPKVPFNNKPCESLTAADAKAIGLTIRGPTADRAPAGLPFDNTCSYGYLRIGYMVKVDDESNKSSNLSTSRQAPADLPGAFYDKQGGLWFATNGYYVTLGGSHTYDVPAARIIVKKLK